MSETMKRALVTGGSGGIGAAICRRLARDGHHVYVHARQGVDAAEKLVGEITAAGGGAAALHFDVTDTEGTRTALESALAVGPIQILVNNAGVIDDAVLPGMRADQWHRVIDVSVNGFFNVTQPLLMPMIRTRWGRIVNISSVSALHRQQGARSTTPPPRALSTPPPRRSRSSSPAVASRSTRLRRASSTRPMSEGLFDAEGDRASGADESRGLAGGSGDGGRLSRLGRSLVRDLTDHFRQRRHGLNARLVWTSTSESSLIAALTRSGREHLPRSWRTTPICERVDRAQPRVLRLGGRPLLGWVRCRTRAGNHAQGDGL